MCVAESACETKMQQLLLTSVCLPRRLSKFPFVTKCGPEFNGRLGSKSLAVSAIPSREPCGSLQRITWAPRYADTHVGSRGYSLHTYQPSHARRWHSVWNKCHQGWSGLGAFEHRKTSINRVVCTHRHCRVRDTGTTLASKERIFGNKTALSEFLMALKMRLRH
jgi:hypothetical protein